MEFLAIALVLLAVVFGLPIVLTVVLLRTRARLSMLEQAVIQQDEALQALTALIKPLRVPPADETPAHDAAQPVRTAPESASAGAPAMAPPARVMPAPPSAPTPAPAPASPSAAGVSPAAAPSTATPVPAPPAPSPLAVPPARPAPPTPPPALPLPPPLPAAPAPSPRIPSPPAPVASRPAVPVPAAPTAASAESGARVAGVPPPRVPSAAGVPLPPPPVPPAPEESGFDWESLVGVKLFSAIAGIALVFAAVFFLRYSVQQGWLQPPVRVLIGTVVGVALLVLCERKAARNYPVTANALDAAGIAILFATFFAAHALWDLIPALVTFGLLAAVTALAVLLSIRRESLFIAVLGLLGGFATPALLSTGENRPIPLFAYLVLLNAGLAWVAHRQAWPMLTGLTLVLTTLYQWGWVLKFLSASELPLAMGIFAIFPVLSVTALVVSRRGRPRMRGSQDEVFEATAMLAAALPVVFAAYLAAVPAYGARPGLLFTFLLLIDLGLLAVAIVLRQMGLHAVGALATLFVWAAWLATSYSPAARSTALLFVPCFVLVFLFAPAIAAWLPRPPAWTGGRTIYAAPVLLFVYAVLTGIDPHAPGPWPIFGPLLALLVVCAWRAAVLDRGALFFVASFFALAAQAVWSAAHLTVDRLPQAVAVYALFGAVTAAAPVLARQRGRAFRPEAGIALVLIAGLSLLLFLSTGPIAPAALWALALLLVIQNAGIFIESASSRVPVLAQVGSALSWLVLGEWWADTAAAVGMLPSLAVLAGFTLVTFGGHAWAWRAVHHDEAGPAAASGFNRGLYIGLTGHLFLFFVAMNREWSLPPYPVFATLAVLTLAAGVTSIAVRAPMLHVLATGAAAAVVAAWTAAGAVMPWTQTGVTVSGVLTLYALGWIAIGRRTGQAGGARAAAAVALFGGELTAILAAHALEGPSFPALLAAHVLNLTVLLALAWWAGWRRVAAGAVAVAWIALLEWQLAHDLAREWRELLILSAALYAVFTVYALLAGPRKPEAREPWLTALAAAAMTFFAARDAFAAAGLEWMIGVVPVAQGLVTTVLLRALLRIERAGQRDPTRLALVAGAALAFVTVAIPLQLEHQWITIGWALEGAALAWLFLRVPHRGLLAASAALFAAVFVRLALNPEIWTYEPRGAMRIFNWYLYTYLIAAASMLAAAWLLSTSSDRLASQLPRLSRLLPGAAVVLLFLLLNIEIADYYSTGPEIMFRFGSTVSQDLTYTIGWLAFGVLLLAAGILSRTRPARVTAVTLIAVTTFKCFLYDLRSLEGLYRVASFVGLAVALALVSLALQKYVLARPKGAA